MTVRPTREEFLHLARDHAVVPVVRELLADLLTPVALYHRVREIAAGPTFLLESVEHGEHWGRYSFVGLQPFAELRSGRGTVELAGDLPDAVHAAAAGGDPLATLQAAVEALRVADTPGLPPLFAGAVGYLGYDVIRHIERIPDSGRDDLGLDDVRLLFPGVVLAFDHLRQRLSVVTNVRPGRDPGAAYDDALAAGDRLVSELAQPGATRMAPAPSPGRVADVSSSMSPEAFMAAVTRAKEHIAAGDAFQVVPSQRFAVTTTVDPLAVYRMLRVTNPSPYMYVFTWDDLQIVGSSPEALVTLRDRTAEIWPIAGSQPRGSTAAEDAAFESKLKADAKELAEHVMLVDLARNDLGRVCHVGSVVVDDFASVVRYSHIMHLVSKVQGRLRDGVGAVELIRATFPAGTLSGAPKVRAMEIIDDLEPTRRGVYGGGIGYVDLSGQADLCIAIRTLVFSGGRAYVQAGAGVVADSVPELEQAEAVNKAMALLAAVEAAEAWSQS